MSYAPRRRHITATLAPPVKPRAPAEFVRLHTTKLEHYSQLYPGIGARRRLLVVQRINVPPGDYIAPLVGVEWKGATAWLYEEDVTECR